MSVRRDVDVGALRRAQRALLAGRVAGAQHILGQSYQFGPLAERLELNHPKREITIRLVLSLADEDVCDPDTVVRS